MADPITPALAKHQCQIHPTDVSFDGILPTYIAAAIDWVENFTGQALEQRTITETFTSFGTYLELSKRPVSTVTEIEYVDEDGADQTFTDFIAQIGANPVRVYPEVDASWPTILDNSAISVTYTAGYADGAAPAGLIQACLLLVGTWFSQREAVVIGDVPHEMQLAVESLCMQKRPVFG